MTKSLIKESGREPWDDDQARRLKVTDLTINGGEKLGFITWDRMLSIMVEKYGFRESSYASAITLLRRFMTPLDFVWRTEREILREMPGIADYERNILKQCIPDIELVFLQECFTENVLKYIWRAILVKYKSGESHKQIVAPGTKTLKQTNF